MLTARGPRPRHRASRVSRVPTHGEVGAVSTLRNSTIVTSLPRIIRACTMWTGRRAAYLSIRKREWADPRHWPISSLGDHAPCGCAL